MTTQIQVAGLNTTVLHLRAFERALDTHYPEAYIKGRNRYKFNGEYLPVGEIVAELIKCANYGLMEETQVQALLELNNTKGIALFSRV